MGRGDDEDVLYPREHEDAQGVVDHGLVVDGHELLAHHLGEGKEPGPRTARKDDAFVIILVFLPPGMPFMTRGRGAPAGTGRPGPAAPFEVSRYHSTVFSSPDSKVSLGVHPSSLCIFEASMAYRRSCPGRS